MENSFRGRRLRKRYFRRIWISRINAHMRQLGLNYNSFFKIKNKKINRKMLAQLALYDQL
uniref:Large ribosomal subunit protein bL20c n=1 Tax=Halimeda discoidea TaxID=118222 RepID=A0A1C9JB91_9CHLO|nr:ribosomal protein L20 [Halimeda discoidea]